MITSKDGKILGMSAHPKEIKKLCMRLITILQDHPRGDFVVSLAVLWLGVCERYNVDPVSTLSYAQKLRSDTFNSKWDTQFMAIKEYMENEL